jgi:chemotaxis protein MotB
VRVEGFTDNLPIRSAAYPSNWELSAGRAASVVHLFMDTGIEPARMAAVGFGEHQPVADNETEQGRRRNRRVNLVILADQDPRQLRDLPEARSGSTNAGAGGADAAGARSPVKEPAAPSGGTVGTMLQPFPEPPG